MGHRLELDFMTDLSGLELASNVQRLLQEAVAAIEGSPDSGVAVDIVLVLEDTEVRLVLEPV